MTTDARERGVSVMGKGREGMCCDGRLFAGMAEGCRSGDLDGCGRGSKLWDAPRPPEGAGQIGDGCCWTEIYGACTDRV